MSVTAGQFYDGTRLSLAVTPAWSVSRHLTLSGAYQLDRIIFEERDERFVSHLARLRTEGTDLYLVWNESLSSERYSLSPRPPLSRARTLLVKYSRTFPLTL